RQPLPTLFPYTTLFRSVHAKDRTQILVRRGENQSRRSPPNPIPHDGRRGEVHRVFIRVELPAEPQFQGRSAAIMAAAGIVITERSEEHTSELQSLAYLV